MKIPISDGWVTNGNSCVGFANPQTVAFELNSTFKNGRLGHVWKDDVGEEAEPMDIGACQARFLTYPHWSNHQIDHFPMNQWWKGLFQLDFHGNRVNVLSYP